MSYVRKNAVQNSVYCHIVIGAEKYYNITW